MTARALVIALAAALLGWFLLRGPAPSGDAPAAPTRTTTTPISPPPSASSPSADDAREHMASIMRLRLERALEAPEELPMPESVQSRIEAETAFEVAMQKLEELAEKDTLPPRKQRARLYRHANDAFAALSAYLDPTSTRDRAALEDGFTRMKAMLAEVGAEPNLD
jgi:hypothetical protein